MELNSLLTDLVKVMKEDRELFSKNTLELFEDYLKSYYKIAAKSVWFGNENISGIIQKTILNSENPKLDWRCISYTKQGLPRRPYEDVQRDHESIYLPLENEVIKDYWQDKSKAELYRQLSAFDPFVEYVIGANDWMKYIRHIFLLNDQRMAKVLQRTH